MFFDNFLCLGSLTHGLSTTNFRIAPDRPKARDNYFSKFSRAQLTGHESNNPGAAAFCLTTFK